MPAYLLLKHGPQGPQKINPLKSLKIQNPSPIKGIFTPATIRNGFHIKFYVTKKSRTSKSIHEQRIYGR